MFFEVQQLIDVKRILTKCVACVSGIMHGQSTSVCGAFVTCAAGRRAAGAALWRFRTRAPVSGVGELGRSPVRLSARIWQRAALGADFPPLFSHDFKSF
jgi:hypothetical protein